MCPHLVTDLFDFLDQSFHVLDGLSHFCLWLSVYILQQLILLCQPMPIFNFWLTIHFPSLTFSDQFSSFQPRSGASETRSDMIQTKEISIQMEVEFREWM